ncbi:MAG: lipid II flippase MurJ, partial [Patescibacteria group bacterium]|nr:lipid II flippase MurJ [Patescibacteria group bacterium]
LLYPPMGLLGLAWGVVLGAFLHLLVQLPEAHKHGWRFLPVLSFDANLKKIIRLMLPRTLGLAASQINLVVMTMLASTLTVGSIAVFSMANNLQSLPISIFALSLAVAVFPTFTQAFMEDNTKMFADNFSLNFRRILYVLVPISVLMLVLRAQLVRVILGTGAFGWENTYYTAQTLGFFALSIFAQGLIPLLARSFYAFEDTKTPMFISIFSIIINIVLAWFLAPVLGVMGLALAFSIANIINMLLLYFVLSIKIKDIDHNKIINSLLKILATSLLCGLAAYLALQVLSQLVNMRTFAGIFIQGAGAALAGLLIYLLASILFKLEEVAIVKRTLLKFWIFLKNGKN